METVLSDLVLMLWVYGGQLVPQQSPSFVQLVRGSMWSSETFLSVFFFLSWLFLEAVHHVDNHSYLRSTHCFDLWNHALSSSLVNL